MAPSQATLSPAAPPQTALEAALARAWEIDPDRTVEAARALTAHAMANVDALTNIGPDLRQRVVELRKAVQARLSAAARQNFVEALANGEGASRVHDAPPAAAEILSRLVTACGPGEFLALMKRCQTRADGIDAEVVKFETAIARWEASYATGESALGEFLGAWTSATAARDKARQKAQRLRDGIASTQADLKARAHELLNSVDRIRQALREVGALARTTPDSVLASLTRDLAGVTSDLAALELGKAGAEPGRIGEALGKQRTELEAAIEARKRELADGVSFDADSLASRSVSADPAALAELVTVVKTRPMAFPPEFGPRIVSMMAGALAGSAEVWQEFLE
jgi:hypothetical protein